MDTWSGGICQTETSIAEAYRDLIHKAEHFIYIEVKILKSKKFILGKIKFKNFLRINFLLQQPIQLKIMKLKTALAWK